MMDFYLFLPKQLEEKIKQYPLTISTFEHILSICPIKFSSHKKSYTNYSQEESSKTEIEIGLMQPLEEQQIGLIHEIVHCAYGAGSWSILDLTQEQKKISDSIEALIENEAQRFYKENKDFVNATYEKLLIQNIAK